MRFLTILLAAVGTLVLTGCDSPSLISMEPAIVGQGAIFDASLLGTWETGQGGDLCVVRRGDGDIYAVTYVSDGNALVFEGRLFLAGPARLMDLAPRDSDDFRIPGHALVRILSSGTTLNWAYLDSDWIRQRAGADLTYHPGNNSKTLLTASTVQLTTFLASYAADDRAHGEVREWHRLQ